MAFVINFKIMAFILAWVGGFCIGMVAGIILGREYLK